MAQQIGMSSHQLKRTWKSKALAAIPFGIGRTKPKHFRNMADVAWKNRDNLSYAWKVLSQGVCDGCSLGVSGFHDWTIPGIHLCMTRLNLLRLNTMPAFDPRLLENVSHLQSLDNVQLRELGRLPYPMVREKDERGFHRITWDEAYQRLGSRIRSTEPRRLAFYLTARGITNEVYYVAQKVARFLGTNNVDNAARLCHAPSTAAMKHALGVAATTCSYKDWYGTDLVIFFGANPSNDQPLTTKYLHEAKKLGTRVVMVNPYCEPGMERYWVPSTPSSAVFGTPITDYWFPVSAGGDIAFLYGTLKILIEKDKVDKEFISKFSAGFDELKAAAGQLQFAELEAQCGLDRSSMEEFADLIGRAKTGVLVWSMGITQHAAGGDAVQMILNLGLARGFVSRDKCGLMPIRGHSSVQGGAEMGAYSTAFPGGKPINAESADALSKFYHFAVPDWPGITTTAMVEACGHGELDLLFCLGGNLLRTLPEPDAVRQALSSVPIRVHQDIILTDQMLIPAREAVFLLPAKTRYEQEDGGTETSTERRVMFSPEIPRQVGEARSEWKILRELAVATYPERAHLLACEDGWKVREEIARVVPIYDGIQHLRKAGDVFQYGGPHLCANGKFETPDGKAHFKAVALPAKPSNVSQNAKEFFVATRRGKQFNTLIYAETDPFNGAPRDAVLMNAEDAASLDLTDQERVTLVNELGRYECRVQIAPIARGNLQVHWPESNHLIRRGITEPSGGVPDYNARVRVEKARLDAR
jgi:molybdopterin-dependent oxidoreductase alpha subunit